MSDAQTVAAALRNAAATGTTTVQIAIAFRLLADMIEKEAALAVHTTRS